MCFLVFFAVEDLRVSRVVELLLKVFIITLPHPRCLLCFNGIKCTVGRHSDIWGRSHVSGSVSFHSCDFIADSQTVWWKQQIVPICCLGCTLFVILLRRETFHHIQSL